MRFSRLFFGLAALTLWPARHTAQPAEVPVPAITTEAETLPGADALPLRPELPAALVFADGRPVTTPAEWRERRAEIRRTLEYYATGRMPPAPGNVTGTVVSTQPVLGGDVVYRLVRLTFGPEKRLELHVGIFTPKGEGPFPAVIIPMGTPPGAPMLPRQPKGLLEGKNQNVLLAVGPGPTPSPVNPPAFPSDAEGVAAGVRDVFRRGYAYVVFNHNDCGEDTTLRDSGGGWAFRNTRFYPAYPGYDWGLLAGWAWGVSRIVDHLQDDPLIDRSRLIVSGVSRLGKSALVAGAFDERIALVAPVITGGGGVGVYRFAGEGRGGKEGLDEMLRKYPNWFSPHLHAFRGRVERLPFDQHWFLALIAPRPFVALEGTEDTVSLVNSVKQSLLAAGPVYALLNASDRLGVNYEQHAHAFTADDWTALLDFADQHLRGQPARRRFDRFPAEGASTAALAAAAPAGVRTELWNGRDLSGWTLHLSDAARDPQTVWSARDGVLMLAPAGNGYLRTVSPFSNYRLHVEWRWPAGSTDKNNSGVLLHMNGADAIWPTCFEVQLKSGNAGQVVGMGLDIPDAPVVNNRKRAPRLAEPTEKPLGEWNVYEIDARGDTLEVRVNGVRQNRVDKLPVNAGQIALQLEGYRIEFRNVWIEPL